MMVICYKTSYSNLYFFYFIDVQMSSGQRKTVSNLTDRMNVAAQAIQVVAPPSTRQANANSNQLADQVVDNHGNGESAHSVVGSSTPFGEGKNYISFFTFC